METTVGRVTTKIRVENGADRVTAVSRPGAAVRVVEIEDALVDTGATLLCLPRRSVETLGLVRHDRRRVLTANGVVDRDVYGGAFLTLDGRSCTIDVMEVPDDVPALVGNLALENLDLVVDPKSQRLIANPAHGGKFTMDLFSAG